MKRRAYVTESADSIEARAREEYDDAVANGVSVKALINGHLIMAGYLGTYLKDDENND